MQEVIRLYTCTQPPHQEQAQRWDPEADGRTRSTYPFILEKNHRG